jgi:hypothetical protein
MAGGVHDAASVFQESFAERVARGAESNCVDWLSVTRTKPYTNMIFPDRVSKCDGVSRHCEERFGVAGAERAGTRQHICKREIEATGRNRAVDWQCRVATRRLHRRGQRVLEERAESAKGIPFQRNAGSHGVTTAFKQEALLHGASHGPAEIDAGYRPSGAGAQTAWLERDGKSRPAVSLFESSRHQPDHPGVPAFRRSNDHSPLLFDSQRRKGLGLGLRKRCLLDLLTLAIKPVKLDGDLRSFRGVLLQQQPHAEIGPADAATRIDAGPEQKSEMPRLWRACQPRRIHESSRSGMLAASEGNEPLRNKCAIETL